MAAYQIKAMTKVFLTLTVLVLSGQVFAQELPAEIGNETGNLNELQKANLSLPIEDLGSADDYPVCHRMKNGVVKHRIQTATTQTAVVE